MTEAKQAHFKRIRRQVIGKHRECFLIALPGLEKLTGNELSTIHISKPDYQIQSGGVRFDGNLADVMSVNLYHRTGIRVLMRLGTFKVEGLSQLQRKLTEIPWELFLYRGQNAHVQVTSRHSRLFHSDAIAQRISQSIAGKQAEMPCPSSDPIDQHLFVRLINNRLTLSLDTSGAPLYKRGLKQHGGAAPLRETLAAAILKTADYSPNRPLLDPMCGTGSFALEAAMISKNMAPGLKRHFAFSGWPAFQPKRWRYLQQSALQKVEQIKHANIFASDFDEKAVINLNNCLKIHNLTDAVRVQRKNFFDILPTDLPAQKGLVVLNPPYGVRLGQPDDIKYFWPQLARKLTTDFRGWRVAMLIPSYAVKTIRPLALKSFRLNHGGINIYLFWGMIS